MSTAKRIAACIPTYNQADYLAQAVESCLKQTRPVDVVYVSDDASTDHTPRVMEELVARDSRVRYIRQPKNLGMAMNPDYVMRHAEADYLVRLDSDDFIHERFVEVLSDALDAHPQAGYAHPAVMWIHMDGREFKESRLFRPTGYQGPEEALRLGVQGSRHCANIVLFRRSALEAVDFCTGNPDRGEDYNLFLKLADAGFGNCYHSDILASFRVRHGKQWNAMRDILEMEGLIQVWDRTLIPAFEKRQWSLAPIHRMRRARAKAFVNILATRKPTPEEWQRGCTLARQMADSAGLRALMALHNAGLGGVPMAWDNVKFRARQAAKTLLLGLGLKR